MRRRLKQMTPRRLKLYGMGQAVMSLEQDRNGMQILPAGEKMQEKEKLAQESAIWLTT